MRYLLSLHIIIFLTWLVPDSAFADSRVDSLAQSSEQYLFQADFATSLRLIDSALLIAKRQKHAEQYHTLLNQKASALTRIGNYDSAFVLHSEVLAYGMNQGNATLEFETKYYLGVLRLFMSDFDLAQIYFLEVIDFFRIDEAHHQNMVARSLTNLAFLAFQKGKLDQAQLYLEKSKAYYSDEPLSIYSAANHILQGLIAQNHGKPTVAIASYQRAMFIYNAHQRVLNLSGLFLNLASAFRIIGDQEKVVSYMDSAAFVAKQYRLSNELQAVYEYKYKYYYDLKQYKTAVDYLLQRDNILDSLRSTEVVLKVANLENNAAEKMEALQLSLLQEKLGAEKKVTKFQRVSIFIAIVISLYLFVLILVYRKSIKDKNRSQQELLIKNNQLEDKTREVAKAQKLLIQSEKMALLGRISAGIAHELNTPLSAVKGNLELIQSLQALEFKKMEEILESMTPEEMKAMLLFIQVALSKNEELPSREQSNSARQKVSKFFRDVEINNKSAVVDYFSELLVDQDIHLYESIYGDPNNVEKLELVSHIIHRTMSVNTATFATEKALKILASFKTYSYKRGWKNLKTINLSSSIDVMLDLYKNDLKNIQVVKTQEGDSQIEGIQDELDQVWTNLISNAVYAMTSKGNLKIHIKGLDNAVSVSIEDTGGGIDVASNHDIFEPFFTTKPEGEGSGLGLDIVKQIVKNHFGSISWKNTDKGVIFTVVLPRSLDKSLLPDE